LTESISNLSI